jgi:vacuolar protein sorting-associated protein 26
MEDHLKVKLINKTVKYSDETIPIRFFLSPYELTPTYPSVNNRFSTTYYINLVLLDIEDRRYFKQHEITMVRLEKKKNSE